MSNRTSLTRSLSQELKSYLFKGELALSFKLYPNVEVRKLLILCTDVFYELLSAFSVPLPYLICTPLSPMLISKSNSKAMEVLKLLFLLHIIGNLHDNVLSYAFSLNTRQYCIVSVK